jgi:hypothetical protein
VHVPGDKAVFDERRNTSRTFAAMPGSAAAALEAMESFRRTSPRHADWIAAGAPSIRSQDDHIRWFGELYPERGRRR